MVSPLRMVLCLLACNAIWGANFTVMKLGLQELSPLVFNTTRLIISALTAWACVGAMKIYRRMLPEDRRAVLALGVLGFALPQVGITFGVSLTAAGNCSIIMALIPVSVLIINRFTGMEKSSPKLAAGVAVSLSGVILIVLGSKAGLSISPADIKGVLVMLAAQFLCGYFTVYSRPLVEKYHPFQIIAWVLTVAAGFFTVVTLPEMVFVDWHKVTIQGWSSAVYSGVLALALANMIWVWGIRYLGSTRVAIFNNITPVFAVATAWLVLGESFSLLQFAGALVVLAGVQFTQKAARELYNQPVEDVTGYMKSGREESSGCPPAP
ncbi:MAG TPA: DMT family transporter [Syntrophomonadaceae bacterium]|nr:DMT family transporter [Syntrophomonadaceae bacterium]HOQ08520.1 DMT family transporter [Syntrophomonadaceae bacterium]